MGSRSGIEWTEATWNPIAGCSMVSPGRTLGGRTWDDYPAVDAPCA